MTEESAGVTLFFRHSRAGGNPDNMKMYSDMRYDPTRALDPRLRGDDRTERGDAPSFPSFPRRRESRQHENV